MSLTVVFDTSGKTCSILGPSEVHEEEAGAEHFIWKDFDGAGGGSLEECRRRMGVFSLFSWD